MKVILYLIFSTLCLVQLVSAQSNHYIYIESENKQPFYVVLNKNIFSAANGGYLIIPQLKNQVYKLQVGFPRNDYAEQNFFIPINNIDYGFVLKQGMDNRWQLMNLLTFNIVSEGDSISNKVSFTDTVLNSSISNSSVEKSIIKKTTTSITADGINETYIDKMNGIEDTIIILIPKTPKQIKPIDATQNCILATEEDFRKLRLQMAAANSETDMLVLGNKEVKEKCFSTEQIKNIGVLFINQQNRLQFFLSAKPYIYDSKNFATLENQFSDSSIISQFRKVQQ